MKSLASKIIFLLLFSTLLLGCDKNYPAPEGTLKIKIVIPQGYIGNAEIEISPVENFDTQIYDIKVGNKTEIEVELNIGNYKVYFFSYDPNINNYYLETQYAQIRQGKTTEITFRKE